MILRTLPDVTSDTIGTSPYTLKWVGMEDIAVPISIDIEGGQTVQIPAKANAYVSLDSTEAKGIHMSRVHAVVNQLSLFTCSKQKIEDSLDQMVASQLGIGSNAKLSLSFDLLLEKSALLSNESGFQTYPVVISAKKTENGYNHKLEITIPYSSTCPCSASLAQQLYADAVHKAFPESEVNKSALLDWIQSSKGSIATPHSQRSYVYIRMKLANNKWPDIASTIQELEKVIGTPVQTAVKRSDEQEFSRLNAANLMFCEDAARRIKSNLEQQSFVADYWFKVEHQESLHAHNAVVVDRKKQ